MSTHKLIKVEKTRMHCAVQTKSILTPSSLIQTLQLVSVCLLHLSSVGAKQIVLSFFSKIYLMRHVVITTLLAPVFFCQKPNILICNPFKWDRVSCWEPHGTHIVLTLLNALLGVDDPGIIQKLGITISI